MRRLRANTMINATQDTLHSQGMQGIFNYFIYILSYISKGYFQVAHCLCWRCCCLIKAIKFESNRRRVKQFVPIVVAIVANLSIVITIIVVVVGAAAVAGAIVVVVVAAAVA